MRWRRACRRARLSGAPKIRAMEIIDEFEKEKRGAAYAGAVGYFAADGSMDTCIVLRTALVKDGMMYVQAGGGVVADSEPEAEYQETVNKARRPDGGGRRSRALRQSPERRANRRAFYRAAISAASFCLQSDRFGHRHQPDAVILGQPGRQYRKVTSWGWPMAMATPVRLASATSSSSCWRTCGFADECRPGKRRGRRSAPRTCAPPCTTLEPAMVRESKKNRCRAASASITGISEAASVENLLPS